MNHNTKSDFNTTYSDYSENKSEIMTGSTVTVLVHGGAVVERRVWSMKDEVLYLCTDRVFGWLKSGNSEVPQPVGFNKKYVVSVVG